MNFLRYMAYALVLVGAINWGLIGLFDFNLVSTIFGEMTILSRIIYILVGLSAIATAFLLPKCEVHSDEYCRCDV